MKALSIKEPWISMIAMGVKTIETRVWKTKYRGPLLLCGSKKPRGDYAGRMAVIVDLVDCRIMTEEDEKNALCSLYLKANSWILKNARQVIPVKIKGQLGLFEVPDNLIEVL